MKPPAFTYHRPDTLAEALRLLGELGDRAKVIAGGQSLVPIMNMRLAAPEHLVDINRISQLAYVTTTAAEVRVGALARHRDLEHDATAYAALPLLRRALTNVAHPTIRNRGTTVGSLVHADPSGEMPAVLALLGGSVEVASSRGNRTIAAEDFFVAPLESSLEPGELALSASFARPRGTHGSAFVEIARRHGDYAMCGVAAVVVVDADLKVVEARASYVSVSATPVVLGFGDILIGATASAVDLAAARARAEQELEPEGDIHATADYRRHLAGVLTERALCSALDEATRQGLQEAS